MRSQIWDACTASANSPPAQAEMGLQQYLNMGIPPASLVLGLPWYVVRARDHRHLARQRQPAPGVLLELPHLAVRELLPDVRLHRRQVRV